MTECLLLDIVYLVLVREADDGGEKNARRERTD